MEETWRTYRKILRENYYENAKKYEQIALHPLSKEFRELLSEIILIKKFKKNLENLNNEKERTEFADEYFKKMYCIMDKETENIEQIQKLDIRKMSYYYSLQTLDEESMENPTIKSRKIIDYVQENRQALNSIELSIFRMYDNLFGIIEKDRDLEIISNNNNYEELKNLIKTIKKPATPDFLYY